MNARVDQSHQQKTGRTRSGSPNVRRDGPLSEVRLEFERRFFWTGSAGFVQ